MLCIAGIKARQSKLITRKACAYAANALGLSAFLQVRRGRPSDDAAAEAFEAVLGAAYKDGGREAAAAIWALAQQRVQSLEALHESLYNQAY